MSTRNRVQLVGNLGQNVKFTSTESGTMIARGSIATHEKYKNEKGERVERTDWHNFVCFGKRAELMRDYTTKGSELILVGSLRTRDYMDEKQQKHYVTEVIVDEVLFLDKKKQ